MNKKEEKKNLHEERREVGSKPWWRLFGGQPLSPAETIRPPPIPGGDCGWSMTYSRTFPRSRTFQTLTFPPRTPTTLSSQKPILLAESRIQTHRRSA
ncbi:hypothetical protein PGTUg99_020987 [Puccinia graminis f. sp. tritici]|uniref:Uncharacterized protein n=1 Tax=Puccinia graminis f. sp. tritici TaxID=56615 RepID=A0A5B0SJM2_PUCGR|nr:hypothetical protein PGTUg99_020987 [Puccinia graminis f. sp. tritici]